LSENPESITEAENAAAPEGAGAIIARNSGWMMGAKLVSSVLSLVFLAIAANKLGAEDYGTLNFVFSIAGFFHILLDLGYMTLLIERASKDRDKLEWHLNGNLGLKLLLYPGGLVLYSLLLFKYPHLWDDPAVFLCGYIFVVLNTQGYLLRGVLMSRETFAPIGKSEVFERFVLLGAGLVVLFTIPSLAPYVLVLVTANFLKVIYLSIAVKRAGVQSRWRWDTNYVTSNWSAALPHALYSIAGMMHYRIDSVMIGSMRPFAEVGLYSASFDKVLGFVMFGQMITNAVTPTASRLFATNRVPSSAGFLTARSFCCRSSQRRSRSGWRFARRASSPCSTAPNTNRRGSRWRGSRLMCCCDIWIYLYASMLLAAGTDRLARDRGIHRRHGEGRSLNSDPDSKDGFRGRGRLVRDRGGRRAARWTPGSRAGSACRSCRCISAWQPLVAGALMGGAVWGDARVRAAAAGRRGRLHCTSCCACCLGCCAASRGSRRSRCAGWWPDCRR
jgi:hypothetical protein